MYTKLKITGVIRTVTGMHIGTSNAFSAIGAVDAPVIRDSYSKAPIIPGSTLKGKLRSLLARNSNEGKITYLENEPQTLKRLFGYNDTSNKGKGYRSRLLFSDMLMDVDKLKTIGFGARIEPTEIKFENTISRLTAVANPRQIERVVRNAEFPMEIIYNVFEPDEVVRDIELLSEGLRLLTYDYLGGHGSRGYGKVRFEGLKIEVASGEISQDILRECNNLLGEVNGEV